MGQHIDEKVLGLYAIDPAAVSSRPEVERHLAACTVCSKAFREIQTFDGRLRNVDVWTALAPDESPQARALRSFAIRSAAENRVAEEQLKRFDEPDQAAHFAWLNVSAKSEYRSGGVARRLWRMAHAMLERAPLYALSLAQAAVSISKALPDDSYPRNSIHELRGSALKEQANALHRLGRLPEALAVLDAAEGEYRQLPHKGIGVIAVQHIRAAVFFEQEQYDAAARLAAETAAAARHLGENDRCLSAEHLQGEILFDRGHPEAALSVFAGILAAGEAANDPIWIARESLTVGACYLELRDLVRAETYLHRARRLFRELKYDAEVTRTEWSLARLRFAQGQPNEGISALRAVVEQLTRHGMLTDAAIAAVDLAEMFYLSGRMREIQRLLAGVATTFVGAGKLTGALTALAYLKDAMTAEEVSLPVFGYVRRSIARVGRNAALVFAPPPGGNEPV